MWPRVSLFMISVGVDKGERQQEFDNFSCLVASGLSPGFVTPVVAPKSAPQNTKFSLI